MKILLDTNIIIDFLAKREPFAKDAKEIIALIETKKVDGYLSASSITTIHYLSQKIYNKEMANSIISDLLKFFNTTTLKKENFLDAISLDGVDFEDSVIITSAISTNIDIIITRDKKGFLKSDILTLKPKEFLATFNLI